MPSDIILIGPVRTGKTTLGQLLAEKLGLRRAALDELRWTYYKEVGYDEDLARHIRQTGGFVALVFYWKLFDAHAVERVLADHRDCVIDFGAGHSARGSTGTSTSSDIAQITTWRSLSCIPRQDTRRIAR